MDGKASGKEVRLRNTRRTLRVKLSQGAILIRPYVLPDSAAAAGINSFSATIEPQLPLDTSGQTFSRIFGTNTSAFELFVLKRKIMGPCWLNIQEPEFSDSAVSLVSINCMVETDTGLYRYRGAS